MSAVVNAPETWKRVIEVEIPVEDITKKSDQKVKKYQKEIKLPGFRAGKVPVKMINSRFGESIRAEVIEELINETYGKACADNKIEPVSQPVIEDVKAENADEPVSYKATVEVDPEIEITNYLDFGVTVEIEPTEDKDIDEAAENIRMRFAEFADLDTPAKEGDFVTLSYSDIKVDGEEKTGFTPAPQMFAIGEAPISELDEALKGMKVDEEKLVSVSYPADYRVDEYASKDGSFSVIVNKVQERSLPELDAEKVLQMAQVESVEDLKNRLREDITKHKSEEGKNKAYDIVIDKILENNDFVVPESRVKSYIAHIMQQEQAYFPNGGQPSVDEYVERYREVAEKSLKRFRILDFIAKEQKVKATKEEVDARIQELATQYNQEFETVKAALRKNGTTIQIREDIKQEKTLEMLVGLQPWSATEAE